MRGLVGWVALLVLAWAFSEDRRRVPWRIVAGGLVLQVALAMLLIDVGPARAAVLLLNHVADALQRATDDGTGFLFGYLGGGALPFAEIRPGASLILAFKILPLVLVISALGSLLFHWGVLQRITGAFAFLLRRALGIDGPLALAAAIHIFVGNIEAPLLIRPYLLGMQRGELFAVMSCGMAGIAGTVMVIYGTILGPVIPNALGTIIVASVISTPAALALSALMIPFEPAAVDRPGERFTRTDAEQPGRAGSRYIRRRRAFGGHYDDAAGGRGARQPVQSTARLPARRTVAGEPVRPALPPGVVADRRALGRDGRSRPADGHEDGVE